MRNTNLLNDYAFKYVFGQDCKEARQALIALLRVFLERKVRFVKIKNSEMFKNVKSMKDARLDLLVEFDDGEQIDLEMQLSKTTDDLQARFGYYLARMHGSQDMKGKFYNELMPSHVLVFLNVKLFESDALCRTFQMKDEHGECYEENPKMRIIMVEMPRLNVDKPLEEMNLKERMIYYFLNCQRGDEDSKIKTMIESDEVIQMVEKRVNTIGEDRWKELQNFFTELHKQEEENERRLALMQRDEAFEQRDEAFEQRDEAFEQRDEAFEQRDEANKRADKEAKRANNAESRISQMVLELSKTTSNEQIQQMFNLTDQEMNMYLDIRK